MKICSAQLWPNCDLRSAESALTVPEKLSPQVLLPTVRPFGPRFRQGKRPYEVNALPNPQYENEDKACSWVPGRTSKGSDMSANEVHVWYASLRQAPTVVSQLRRTLTPEDWIKVERKQDPNQQNEFIVTRALLRMLIGHYTGLLPNEIRFCHGPNGKPSVQEDPSSRMVKFSLSHSAGMLACAFAAMREIGIDLEGLRPVPIAEKFARRFFDNDDQLFIARLGEPLRSQVFYEIWTRKEAQLKAMGQGVRGLLVSPGNSLEDCQQTPNNLVHPKSIFDSCWSGGKVPSPAGYVATVVAKGLGFQVDCKMLTLR